MIADNVCISTIYDILDSRIFGLIRTYVLHVDLAIVMATFSCIKLNADSSNDSYIYIYVCMGRERTTLAGKC